MRLGYWKLALAVLIHICVVESRSCTSDPLRQQFLSDTVQLVTSLMLPAVANF